MCMGGFNQTPGQIQSTVSKFFKLESAGSPMLECCRAKTSCSGSYGGIQASQSRGAIQRREHARSSASFLLPFSSSDLPRCVFCLLPSWGRWRLRRGGDNGVCQD